MVTRRKLLTVGGGALASSSLAGCSYFDEPRYTSINVGNRTEEQQTIRVTVLDAESDTRSGLFTEKVELDSITGDSSTELYRNAFEAQRALVEVRLTKSDMQQQFVYQRSQACKERERGDVLRIRFHNPYAAKWDVACTSQ